MVDVDSHRRGQTSRSVFGDKTETNSDFKALMYRYSYFLDFTHTYLGCTVIDLVVNIKYFKGVNTKA